MFKAWAQYVIEKWYRSSVYGRISEESVARGMQKYVTMMFYYTNLLEYIDVLEWH